MLEDQDGHPEEPPPAYTSMPPQNSSPSHVRGPHPLEGLRFILLDGSEPLPSEWRRALAQHIPRGIREQFTVIHARLNELTGLQSKFDCIVSPANVHGRLGAGFDYHLARALAPPSDPMAPTRLTQSEVYKQWKGYQPPGTCTLVSLHNTPCENNPHGCSYIALCPTMRIPSSITWNKEIVYNCMWSLLVTLDAHNQCINTDESGGARTEKRIGKVLMTGFGTGTGGISAERCAQQMALAVRDYVDASTHKEKWRMMNVDDSFRYANDCRRTHDM